MSYSLKIDPNRRAGSRFIGKVRKALISAALDEKKNGVSQASIAKALGVNKSVINRLLRGDSNLTLRSVGEIAFVLGYEPDFHLQRLGSQKINEPLRSVSNVATTSTTGVVRQPAVRTNSPSAVVSVSR